MVVTVEIEHLKEVLAVFFGEDGIFGDNVTGKNSLFVFLSKFFAAL